MKVIAIAAGGTGGHIIPALALAEELKSRGFTVFFIGTGKVIERKLVSEAGYELVVLPFAAVLGKGFSGVIRFISIVPLAVFKTFILYFRKKPKVVVGFGGYPAFLPVLIAFFMRIPRIIHEQNVQVGLANKILSIISNQVFSVKRAKGFFVNVSRVQQIGNPVRKAFFQIPDWKMPERAENFNLLVLGGSQGAAKINEALVEIAEFLKEKKINLIHQTGEKDFIKVTYWYKKINYSQAQTFKFIDDIVQRYQKTHLIISRAGAMSVAEIVASGRPAIFIPLQIAKAHQRDNINFLRENKAAIMLEQDERLGAVLKETISQLLANFELLEQMAKKTREFSLQEGQTATEKLAQAVISYTE